jgi:hypothetical protein
MTELAHIYAGDVTAAKVTDTPRHYSATGYGPKIPTSYMLQCWGVWRRVYVVNYGNSGSTYVIRGGVSHYLSPGVNLILETIRDGGTLEGALESMAQWPDWMKDGEHITQLAVVRWPEHRRGQRVRIVNSPSDGVYNVTYVDTDEPAVIHADNLDPEGNK